MANIKVLLADDHKIVRDGIKLMLEPQAGIHVVAEGANGEEVLHILKDTLVDLVVMDINMPEMDGIRTTRTN
jgi:YesN/AraC family two-component response regulator